MKTIGRILLGMVLGALVGGGGMWLYMEYVNGQHDAVRAEQEFLMRRKAHKDSLLQIRAEQENRERLGREDELRRRAIAGFIADFYREAILGRGTVKAYEMNLTEHCRERLKDGSGRLTWSLFGADAAGDDTDREALRHNLRVTYEEDDWYRVHLILHGMTEFRYVKAVVKGRDVMIDDVR